MPLGAFSKTAGLVASVILLLTSHAGVMAQQEDQESLAKKSQNPLGEIISFTFDNSLSFGNGPEDGVQYTNDLKLVYPTEALLMFSSRLESTAQQFSQSDFRSIRDKILTLPQPSPRK